MSAAGSAIIVGFGPGIGAAAATTFAAAGYRIALLARDGAKVKEAATTIGSGAAGFAADAADEASLLNGLDQAQATLGEPDILLYNAAFWRPGPVLATLPGAFEADYRTDLVGAVVMAQWAAPTMRARRAGTILFTGGGFALYPSPLAPTLSLGKAAIRALAIMLAEELAPDLVRVGTVTVAGTVGDAPGQVAPARVADAFMQIHIGPPQAAEVVIRP